ncbi:hypothetical protein DPMN_089322 [Dreissena polymorpha]|uniref:Sulfotransferase n=1 Tax=Dreissena polymorpha TaxID=45954 RepID=A0A9D4KVR9_DREPO|nr:hypothetical protein DPMN_089322 [Dreissena polymorpha]
MSIHVNKINNYLSEIHSLNKTGTFHNRSPTNSPTNGVHVYRKKDELNIVNQASVPHVDMSTFNKEDSSSILSNGSIILVIAYMRTGSTLTASILRESERSFYVFEPLHKLEQAFVNAERNKLDNVTFEYATGKR